MAYLYHGSDKKDLSKIIPRISSHGKKYLYATKYKLISLLFLSRWNDYLLTLSSLIERDNLHITLVERYKNAFDDIYSKKTGYIYTLDDKHFFNDPNCWELELVSEFEETPVSCERIDDILREIKNIEMLGDISLYYYPDRPSGIPIDDMDLVQKSIDLYKLNGDIYNAVYCAER